MSNEVRRSGAKTAAKGNASKRSQAKKKGKVAIFVVELLVLAVLIGALWILKDFGTANASGGNTPAGQGGTSGEGMKIQVDFDEAMSRGQTYRPFEIAAREKVCNLFKKEVE